MGPKRRGKQKAKKLKKMRAASSKMDVLAKKLGKWDPQATIRKFRDRNMNGKSFKRSETFR